MGFWRSIISAIAIVASAPSPVPIPYPVIVNGKPLANAIMINGALAISIEDFAKAVGAEVTVQGNRLVLHYRPGRQKPGTIKITKDINATKETFGGRNFIRLSDIAAGFGGSLVIPGNLAPGAPIILTFAPNPNAALQTH